MQVTAKLNYLRISPRKVRAVAEVIRGLEVDSAQAQLRYLVRKPARPLLKLLDSAVANAQRNFGLDKDHLYIKDIVVNEGVKLKRYKPKGFGLVMPIQKKTSHIKIILEELPEERVREKKAVQPPMAKPEPEIKEEKLRERSPVKEFKKKPKVEIEKGRKKGVFGGIKEAGRKIFRRKSI